MSESYEHVQKPIIYRSSLIGITQLIFCFTIITSELRIRQHFEKKLRTVEDLQKNKTKIKDNFSFRRISY